MFYSFVKQNWFLLGIGAVIILAHFEPWFGSKDGPLYPDFTVKYLAVAFIFFSSGLSLKSEELTNACFQVRLHFFIQFFTLGVVPCLMCLLLLSLSLVPIDPWLLKGIQVLGCMPPPVSSAVILTKSVGGNEAGAIFNSALGSFLGIFFTPMLLLMFVGSSATVPYSTVISQLSISVVLPIVFGQIARRILKEWLMRKKPPFGTVSSCMLLLIIYTTFCDTLWRKDVEMDTLSVMTVISLVVFIQVILLLLVFFLSTRPEFNFTPEDVVAVLFCATHKSLTLGIPIIKIIYNNHPQLSSISVPLLIYHPTQIILGGLLVPSVRAWMVSTQRFRFPRPKRKIWNIYDDLDDI